MNHSPSPIWKIIYKTIIKMYHRIIELELWEIACTVVCMSEEGSEWMGQKDLGVGHHKCYFLTMLPKCVHSMLGQKLNINGINFFFQNVCILLFVRPNDRMDFKASSVWPSAHVPLRIVLTLCVGLSTSRNPNTDLSTKQWF